MNRSELITRIKDDHAAFIQFVGQLSEEQLRQSKPNKWNAIRQAEHIYRCLRPIRLALSLPKWIPLLLFGKSKTGSRDYATLVEAYQLTLQAGGKAPAAYVPRQTTATVEHLLPRLQQLVDKLVWRVALYEESQFDRIRLPHPLLGKLTVRELLYFTIYHVEHHHRQAVEQIRDAVYVA